MSRHVGMAEQQKQGNKVEIIAKTVQYTTSIQIYIPTLFPYFLPSCYPYISLQEAKIFPEKQKGFRDGLSYSTPQKSEEGEMPSPSLGPIPLKKCRIQKSEFFGGLFLSSHVLKGTFASIFVNCQAVSFKISVAIPKQTVSGTEISHSLIFLMFLLLAIFSAAGACFS